MYNSHALRFLKLIILFHSTYSFATLTQFYSESIYHNEKDIYTSATTLNIIIPAINDFKYQISAGNDFAFSDQAKLYDYSYFYAGIGVRYLLFDFAYLLAETRARFYLDNKMSSFNKLQKLDQRLLFVINKNLFSKKLSKQLIFNNEFYSETLFSTLDQNNLTHFDLIRSGPNYLVSSSITLAAFMELNIKFNKNAGVTDNYFEYKPTLSVKKDWQSTSLTMMAFYFKKNYFKENPTKNDSNKKNKNDIHLQLILAGQF